MKLTTGLKIEGSSFSNVDFMPDVRLAWDASAADLLWFSVSRADARVKIDNRELEAPEF